MQRSTSSSSLASFLSAASEGATVTQDVSVTVSDKVAGPSQSSDQDFPVLPPSTVDARSVPMSRSNASSGSMTPPLIVFEPTYPTSVSMERCKATSGFVNAEPTLYQSEQAFVASHASMTQY
ncbi:hypothetical protein M408DRAFT_29095 [Serendipita vermifera MAFF 305830]|uniref:Uncharacterized protein n=1 Tax=Serendipita vermifera MAFF 305830 TaxID=933852 RepID=A0A0C2WXB8_SERVB|nr:hypothetical protein M408DRAFT_29095 [Serendipita vermifera MAFF 305830]